MTQLQFRRDSTANWASENPTLVSGEVGFVNAGADAGKFKIGDGTTAWNSLAFVQTVGPTGATGAAPVQTINAQTADYTLVLGDASNIITMTSGSAKNITVPLFSSVAFPVATRIDLVQMGAGQVTVVATGGVTIVATPGLKLAAQYSTASLLNLGTDSWLLVGSLAA
jgi:hypothetical protein